MTSLINKIISLKISPFDRDIVFARRVNPSVQKSQTNELVRIHPPPDRLSNRSVELVTDLSWIGAFPPDWIVDPPDPFLSVARSTFRKFSPIE